MTNADRRFAVESLDKLGMKASRADVRKFQRDQRIKVDGIIGPQTRGALRSALQERERSGMDPNVRVSGERRAPTEVDRSNLPPGMMRAGALQQNEENRRTGDRQKFDQYASMVRAAGGEVNPNGQATVLGIRARDGVTKKFEDKIVVLNANGTVNEFAGSTRPANTTWRNGGVAQLQPGNYKARPHGDHNGRPSWEVTTLGGSGRVPVARDLNGDGQYSDREKNTPRTGTGILFHVPMQKVNDRVPTSIGCLNIRNADWSRFMRAVGGTRAGFSFTLI